MKFVRRPLCITNFPFLAFAVVPCFCTWSQNSPEFPDVDVIIFTPVSFLLHQKKERVSWCWCYIIFTTLFKKEQTLQLRQGLCAITIMLQPSLFLKAHSCRKMGAGLHENCPLNKQKFAGKTTRNTAYPKHVSTKHFESCNNNTQQRSWKRQTARRRNH